jgi:transposase
MKEYIAFDSHKRYTLAEWEDVQTSKIRRQRVEHGRGAIRKCLQDSEPGTPVAVEAVGNWYWIVQEIEQAGMVPQLVHPRKAKLMMGMINKTDKLDVHGLNVLQRNRTLPVVWIPPASLRDLRELTRGRLSLSRQRTRIKCRLHSSLDKYGLSLPASDIFAPRVRPQLKELLTQLPEYTRLTAQQLLDLLDAVDEPIRDLERTLKQRVKIDSQLELLTSLPGIGPILATTTWLEVGTTARFPSAAHLASYAGTTPRVHASGGKTRYGKMRPDVNRYLKWAFAEASNSIALNRKAHPDRHVSRLYERLRVKRGHPKAIGAVSRHLAEATYWILEKQEPYRDPARGCCQRGHKRDVVMSSGQPARLEE